MSKIAFLFSGQGAQTVGMGRSLAESLPAARRLYDQANDILGYDLARLCFGGPEEKLNSTVHSQPALFVTCLAAVESLRERSPQSIESCQAAAGLSLGEYTALVFAGVMDFEAGLKLVQRRGEAMQQAAEARPSGMVSVVGPTVDEVRRLCDAARGNDVLQVANMLCPGSTVVSGDKEACERLMTFAEQAGARAVQLAVAGAFHTPIMHPADEQLADALRNVKLSPPRLPVISNVDAQPHDDPEEIRRLLIEQIIQPVRWEDSLRYMLAKGCEKFYDIGPGNSLRSMLRRVERKAQCESVDV